MFHCFDIFMFKLTKCEISPNSEDKTHKINKNDIQHRQFTSIKRQTFYTTYVRAGSRNRIALNCHRRLFYMCQTGFSRTPFLYRQPYSAASIHGTPRQPFANPIRNQRHPLTNPNHRSGKMSVTPGTPHCLERYGAT